MKTKNLVLFFVLSAVSVIAMSYLQHWLRYRNSLTPVQWESVQVASVAAANAGGVSLGDNARLIVHYYPPRPSKTEKPKPPEPEKTPPVVEKLPVEDSKAETIPFGDESFKLRVQLSSQGASVREVILNQFQAADWYGLGMWRDGNRDTPLPVHLVPAYRVVQFKDNRIQYDYTRPYFHYTLYHYENPGDEFPVDTLGKIVWRVKKRPSAGENPLKAEFEADVPGQDLTITKTFILGKGDYDLGLVVTIRPNDPNRKDRPKFRYQLMGSHGLPIEGVWYTSTYRNALIGKDVKGNSERTLEDPRQISHWGGGELHVRDDKVIRYAGVAVQYFASVVAVNPEQNPGVPSNFIEKVRATIEDVPDKTKPFLDDITVRLMTEKFALDSGEVVHQYTLYNGPVKVRLLGHLSEAVSQVNKQPMEVSPERVDFYQNKLQLNTLTDFHSPGALGSFANSIYLTPLIITFTNLIHNLIYYLHHVIPWYGLCILAVTVIVRGCMFPLSRKQAKNTQEMQEKMAKLAPEVKKLQEKFKDDFQALNQARTQLYLQHGINPLSTLGGCLLLFIQMPVFLGLYYALQESISFRLDHFLWIRNLAAPDMLIWWGEHIWWISEPSNLGGFFYLGPFFNLLPIIAVALMLVQQQMMTPPAQDEQQAMQMKMMKYMMIFFGLMFYKVAAGLCIYFIASSLWGVCERKLLPKKKPPTPGTEPEEQAAPSGKGAAKTSKAGKAETNGGAFRRLKDWWGEVLENAAKQQQARRDEGKRKKEKK
jgi:YidC/Oxa1 family membrane protein insertase